MEEKIRLYREVTDPEKIVQYQLRQFNRAWLAAQRCLSFYQDWARQHALPNQVTSVAELQQFPVLTKEVMRDHQDQIARDVASTKGLYYVSTGGSTGVPIRVPTSKAEKDIEYANTYLGKAWWGIKPFDRVLQLWGHSHLFGSGWNGKLKEVRRQLYDRVVRTRRLSVYNMSGDCIRQYTEEIARTRPEAIIGYTSAVFKVAQYARTHGISMKNPRLKGVIVTAETATGSDIALIGDVFGKPVIIEYGMAETGVIAYSRNATEQCSVFWDSFLCVEDEGGLLVSTIYDRCFPLINYRTADRVADAASCNGSVLGFSNIKGRAQEILILRAENGRDLYLVGGILIVHILKARPGIYSVASKQVSKGVIQVLVTCSTKENTAELESYLAKTLSQEFGLIDRNALSVVQADVASQSLAGKHLPVIADGSSTRDSEQ